MVKYNCEVCEKAYDVLEEAEECKKREVVGPDITPGTVFTFTGTENENVLIVYSELNSKNHEKQYLAEQFLFWEKNASPTTGLYYLSGSELGQRLENDLEVPSNKVVKNLNKLIEEEFMGTGMIKISMEKYGAKELHNNFNLERLTSQR